MAIHLPSLEELGKVQANLESYAQQVRAQLRTANPQAYGVGDKLFDQVQKAMLALETVQVGLGRQDEGRIERGWHRLVQASERLQQTSAEFNRLLRA